MPHRETQRSFGVAFGRVRPGLLWTRGLKPRNKNKEKGVNQTDNYKASSGDIRTCRANKQGSKVTLISLLCCDYLPITKIVDEVQKRKMSTW